MIITAKFPSRCEHCGRPIKIGDLIDYIRGQPANHARCPVHDPMPTGHRGRQINEAYKARKRERGRSS